MASLLNRDQVLQAAHELYCTSVVSRLEELRKRNPYPQNWDAFCEWVERLDDTDQLEIMWRLLGRVEQAWGYDVGLVFHHMGITANEQSKAIYYLILGCTGCGLGLEDHFEAQLDNAAEILLRYPSEARDHMVFDPSPFTFEETDWMEAAETAFPDLRLDPRD